ncbi:MAG: hypothetical protein DCF17_10095 [Shackletoniella antarctica]|uniref:Peptidase M15A C-terminal domain-containing protein n=1 Tax=Shackletoniella antarctica TaxID=268115 RepID=A0A2W4Y4A1_9CYAN|nr:MAG: hypothetical protein DCF17_10095 [Shackletoniella antarctica]
MGNRRLGKYLTLTEFCTCTQTYARYADQIDPFPKNLEETLPAIEALCQYIVDPVIEAFGRDSPSAEADASRTERLRQRFLLTYGFCSTDLKRWLAKKDPATGKKHGIATPSLDQHMAHEVNRNGRYYCDRLGAACDFRILDLPSNELVDWVMGQGLPFDSLYFYGTDRPIHISYGPQHKRDIWAFTAKGTPTRMRDWDT